MISSSLRRIVKASSLSPDEVIDKLVELEDQIELVGWGIRRHQPQFGPLPFKGISNLLEAQIADLRKVQADLYLATRQYRFSTETAAKLVESYAGRTGEHLLLALKQDLEKDLSGDRKHFLAELEKLGALLRAFVR